MTSLIETAVGFIQESVEAANREFQTNFPSDIPGHAETVARLASAEWTIKAKCRDLIAPGIKLQDVCPLACALARLIRVIEHREKLDLIDHTRQACQSQKDRVVADWSSSNTTTKVQNRHHQAYESLSRLEDSAIINGITQERTALKVRDSIAVFKFSNSVVDTLRNVQSQLIHKEHGEGKKVPTVQRDIYEHNARLMTRIRRQIQTLFEENRRQQANIDVIVGSQKPSLNVEIQAPRLMLEESDGHHHHHHAASSLSVVDAEVVNSSSPSRSSVDENNGASSSKESPPRGLDVSTLKANRKLRGKLTIDTKKCRQEEIMLDYLTNMNRCLPERYPATCQVQEPSIAIPPKPTKKPPPNEGSRKQQQLYILRKGRMSISSKVQNSMVEMAAELEGLGIND